MYTLVSAYGVGKNISAKWGTYTVGNLAMNAIFSTFRHLTLTLTAPFLVEPIHVDFEHFRPGHSTDTSTLDTVLAALDNSTLPTLASVQKYTSEVVEYNDAFRAGYKIEIAAPASHPSSIVFPDDKTEVVVTRPNTNMRDVFDYCMVSINGFLHHTDTDNEKLYVLEGGKSLLKSRQNQIGFYSFEKLGKISQHRIVPEMVYAGAGGSFLSHRAYFDLSSLDTEGKTVMFVIGGYLYMPFEGHVQQTNDSTFMIDFNAVPILERYYESLQYLDLSSLGLPKKISSPAQINVAQLFSDAVFLKYLTHAQSFVVLVDTPRMYAEKHYLKTRVVPGEYTLYTEPKLPFVIANGRFAEYWKTKEFMQWSIRVHDAYYHNRVARSVDQKDIVTVTDASQPYRTYQNSVGYLLSLGGDKPIP